MFPQQIDCFEAIIPNIRPLLFIKAFICLAIVYCVVWGEETQFDSQSASSPVFVASPIYSQPLLFHR